MVNRAPHVAVVGGGWAGLAAAVAACQRGWRVTLLEASPHWGGRARRVPSRIGPLDNGQHILIGAYHATLTLLATLGVPLTQALQRVPMALTYPDGGGLRVPGWTSTLPRVAHAVGLGAALLVARGWTWRDQRAALARLARWQLAGWRCAPTATVAELCAGLPRRVVADWIEPLAVAALNTPLQQASGAVWLRVLDDALHGPAPAPYAPSDLLLPRADLGTLLPDAATRWLAERGATLRLRARVTRLQAVTPAASPSDGGNPGTPAWHLAVAHGTPVQADAVVLATPAWASTQLLQALAADPDCPAGLARRGVAWADRARALQHIPIATVWLAPPPGWAWRWPTPMLALRHHPQQAPAQFVFARAADHPAAGLRLAAVVSAPDPAWHGRAADLAAAVQRQVQQALALPDTQVLATVVEQRATFACTPGLARPWAMLGPTLVAAGDHVEGPYPATLEGAVRSGLHAVDALGAALTPGFWPRP
ncbi:hydroxysqualene dehydroxylase [Tepidimonas aquatica]|uniref:tRNA 5-methylaminomethyl-2-thiouridine biosynthesis bifunctional protein MnmC n=1 Tax=Tepidimonas aquatica TaxID=247482 RepID=A0A554WPL7_9BURK|nr:FAD-dependent oxidoreductase [Tepidimonas aquatica]TSE25528.1 tRNA 5-methylaminomethyl-2-thiouridine biosynthesis bifunctional protein MnmC [Tepidimonas aquatica]